MRNHLFQHINELQPETLSSRAVFPGLDPDAFIECMESDRWTLAVDSDDRRAVALGIKGTPSFLIGYPSGDGTEVKIVKRIDGAQPYAVFARVVDELLAAAP